MGILPMRHGRPGQYLGSPSRATCYHSRMIYFISFLAVAAIPLLIGGYGAHVAAKVLERAERRKALAIIWVLAVLGVLLSGVQQVLVYRSDHDHEAQQAAMRAKADNDLRELRDRLDRSLQHEEDVKEELGSIVQFLHTPQPKMDTKHLAVAASQMVEHAMHR